jgi:VanZ family protein
MTALLLWINTQLKKKYYAIGYSVFVWIMCSFPSKSIPKQQLLTDKTLHVIAFAGFCFFWYFLAKNKPKIMLISVLFGVMVEIWQAILPASFQRGFEWLDIAADTIGVALGAILAVIFTKISHAKL